eukprot:symbB.v1.2.014441.t1/scaffold1054.1/size141114/13
MLVHAIAQPELEKDDGPIGIVLCPTRELAVQIETETYKFNKQLGMRSITLAGGLSKLEQFKEVKRGAEIAICNPGRLIDVVKMKGCNLQRCTYIVLDEADRMFHMGFEYQMRSIVQNIRPSRQTLLFSATFPHGSQAVCCGTLSVECLLLSWPWGLCFASQQYFNYFYLLLVLLKATLDCWNSHLFAALEVAWRAMDGKLVSKEVSETSTQGSEQLARNVSKSSSSKVHEQVTIEEKFESDFSEYIKERSSWRSYKLGAVGAAFGGALGVAASPLVVPGLALAALVGGAGGYQWAKYWGSQELQHETSHGEGDIHPTMRRLKFMVKWSQWQLKAYHGASVEARMTVLDEVTRAFSPWVQRLYLLRAQGPSNAELEIAEVQEHLAPLFFLLHRRVAVETIEFGTKLEHAKTLRSKGQNKSKSAFSPI